MPNNRRGQIKQFHKQAGDHLLNCISEYARCLTLYVEQSKDIDEAGGTYSEEFTLNGEMLSTMLESLNTLMEAHNDLHKSL